MKRRSDDAIFERLLAGGLRGRLDLGGGWCSAEDVDGWRPGQCVASNDRGVGAGCCVSHTESGFIRDQLKPKVRDGMREGWFAAGDSD
jgi:hypothetical protein